ncbi:hypothetical protein QM565_19485 [Geitlerinema splendidum]|nr:hypothetical protein [Geitlerinema splendidum]
MLSKKKTSGHILNDMLIKHCIDPRGDYDSIETITYFKNHMLCLINGDTYCDHAAPLFLHLRLFSLHKKKRWKATFTLSHISEGPSSLETPIQYIFSKALYQTLIEHGIKSNALFFYKRI